MKIVFSSSQSHRPAKAGFTLVEMLVATALVVLMMLLFAQVFQTSSGLVSNQKGMAKMDQAVRTLTILLRGDIRQRTFVDVVPFVANQDGVNARIYDPITQNGYDASLRQGFFSISENDPDDPTDDVLHLTVRTDSPLAKSLRLPYSGKSRLLRLPGFAGTNDQYLQANTDQPEFDDGQLTVNNTGSSRYAEVCWFVRHGKLYRRIFLIRDPYYRGTNATFPEEPQDNAGTPLITTIYDPDNNPMTSDHFWRDFDYSAYWEPNEGLKFHTSPESMTNRDSDTSSLEPTMDGLPRSLGNPVYRFGSSPSRYKNGLIYPPRDHILVGGQKRFIGRFTQQETADPDFNYPGNNNNDPYNFTPAMPAQPLTDPFADPPGRTFSINTANGLVDPYHDDSARRGEDVVLSDVHEFDIQVWDDGMSPPGFVNLGHTGTSGFYRAAASLNTTFGNSYDTWHPSHFMPSDPPFAPYDNTTIDGPRVPAANSNGLGSQGEIWLKAIRIKVRFFDLGSEQMRDLTFTFRLDRKTIAKD